MTTSQCSTHSEEVHHLKDFVIFLPLWSKQHYLKWKNNLCPLYKHMNMTLEFHWNDWILTLVMMYGGESESPLHRNCIFLMFFNLKHLIGCKCC